MPSPDGSPGTRPRWRASSLVFPIGRGIHPNGTSTEADFRITGVTAHGGRVYLLSGAEVNYSKLLVLDVGALVGAP